MTRNGQFHLICNFSNLFPTQNDSEWSIFTQIAIFQIFSHRRMTWNGQFHLICNFSNLFPPKWLRMTWNGQFCPICNFPIFSTEVAQNDSEWNDQFSTSEFDLQLFQSFPTKVAQNDSEWPNFARFAIFPIFSHRSGSE